MTVEPEETVRWLSRSRQLRDAYEELVEQWPQLRWSREITADQRITILACNVSERLELEFWAEAPYTFWHSRWAYFNETGPSCVYVSHFELPDQDMKHLAPWLVNTVVGVKRELVLMCNDIISIVSRSC